MSVRTDVINLSVNINGDNARNQLNDLRKKAADLSYELKNGVTKGTQEYINKAAELKDVKSQMDSLKQSIGLTSLTQKELNEEVKKLSALRGSVTPFTEEWKIYNDQLQKVIARQFEVKNGVQGFGVFLHKISEEVKHLGILAAGYLGFEFITSQARSIVNGNAKISDSLSQLKIYLHGSTEDAQQLYQQLRKLDTRTGNGDLLDIATIVAKKGVAKDEIVGVTKALDQLFVVLGKEVGDPHEAVASLVKLVNVYSEDHHVTSKNIGDIGAAIQKLTSSGVATGDFLINFAERLAGVRGITGITIQSVLGLGAALQELGQKNESAATAAQKLIVQMFLQPAVYAKAAEQSVEDFSKTLAKDPVEALIKVAGALKNSSAAPQELINAFKEMDINGARVFGVLGDIAGNAEYMRKRLKDANEAFGNISSITEAFNEKNENLAATIAKLGKSFNSLVFSSGVSNFLKDAVNGTANFIQTLKHLPQTINDNRTALIAITGAVLTYIAVKTRAAQASLLKRAAVIVETATDYLQIAAMYIAEAATKAYALAKGVLTGQITLATAAQRVFNVVLASNPLGAVLAVITLAATAISFLTSKTKELTSAEKAKQEVERRAADSYAEEEARIRTLTSVINSNAISLDTRKKALDELIKINPEYLSGLTLENIKTQEGIDKINAYVKALRQKATVQAAQDLNAENLKKDIKLQNTETGLEKKIATGQTGQRDLNDGEKEFLSIGRRASFGISEARLDLWANTNAAKEALQEVRDQRKKIQEEMDATDEIIKANFEKQITTASDNAGKKTSIAEKIIAITIEKLKQQIKDLNDQIENLPAETDKDVALIRQKQAQRDKIQVRVDFLEGKQKKDSEYERLKKEAEKFYQYLLKLQKEAAIKGEEPMQKEIDAVKIKYEELTARSLEFYKKQIINKKKHGEEEKIIEESQRNEIDAIVKKYFNQGLAETAKKEYDLAVSLAREYYAKLKTEAAQSYADGKTSKAEYTLATKKLDAQEKSDLLIIAKDYAGKVKKAQDDVTRAFEKDEAEKTKLLVEETDKRIQLTKAEAIAKANSAIITSQPGTVKNRDAQKDLAKIQYDQDVQALKDKYAEEGIVVDDNNVILVEKHDAYVKQLEDIDHRYWQQVISNIMQYVNIFQSALNSLNQIITNRENKQLADEKKRNDAKKKDYQHQLDNKLISQNVYNIKTQKADDDLAKKQAEIQREQAKREKALKIFSAIINTATAVTQALSSFPPPASFILAAATAVAGGLEIAAISSQPLPELGAGGILRNGPKHKDSQKGLHVVDPITGKTEMLLEREEAVMSAAAMKDDKEYLVKGTPSQIASGLNALNGGTSWNSGALIQMAKWRTEKPASINSNMPKILEQGGIIRPINKASTANDLSGSDNAAILIQMKQELSNLRDDVKGWNERLHAVVSIKEYEKTKAQYDAAKKVSSLSQ